MFYCEREVLHKFSVLIEILSCCLTQFSPGEYIGGYANLFQTNSIELILPLMNIN